MACNWLPHNLNEVAQAIYDYMDGKEPMLPGPDFPTGGIVINKNDIPNIMRTGHGSVKVRGRYKIEKQNIIFYEIPYGIKTEDLMSEIGEVSDSKEIEGITDIRNESNKKGLRIVIQCAKGISPESIVSKLFLKTNLQTSISYNQVALIDKTPTELNLKQCIEVYVNHNIDCLIKEFNFDLEKANARLHIVEGLLVALEDIDNVIALIKSSANSTAARSALMEKYHLSEIQAKSILAMRLSSLAKLEKMELENEKKELIIKIEELKIHLSNRDLQLSDIRIRLENFVKKYGDKRRTELTHINIKPDEKEIAEVTPENVVVILSQDETIKKVPSKSFKVQRKNGKGVKGRGDIVLDAISTNTIDTLMIFTSKGKMYRLLVDNVPTGTNASRGVAISSLINTGNDERVIAITSLHRKTDAKYVIFVTKLGLVKKTSLEEYMKVKRSTGIAAINIKEGDSLANVTFVKDEDMVLVTKKGMSIHFPTEDINPIGRVTAGVKSIKLMDDDEVIVGLPIHREQDSIAIFTTKGFAKKTPLQELPLQQRAGKGLLIYKPTDITGEVIGAEMVSNEDNVLIVGNLTHICISAKDIPELSRVSIGNIMLKNKILSVVKL